MSFSSNTQIVQHLYYAKEINLYAKNITEGNRLKDDLLQELWLHLMEMDNVKLNNMLSNDCINYYCIKYLCNQYRSNTSPFHMTYRAYHKRINYFKYSIEQIDQEPTAKQQLLSILPILQKEYEEMDVHWYDRKIWELYLSSPDMSTHKLSKELDIPIDSIKKTCRKVKNILKQIADDNKHLYIN